MNQKAGIGSDFFFIICLKRSKEKMIILQLLCQVNVPCVLVSKSYSKITTLKNEILHLRLTHPVPFLSWLRSLLNLTSSPKYKYQRMS